MPRTLLLITLIAALGCGESPRKAAVKSAPKKAAEGKRANVGKNVWFEVLPDGRRQVVVSTYVVLRQGHLELLLTKKHGKEHEAILAADVDAQVVHKTLVAAEAEPGTPARFDPEFAPATGTPIEVTLSWTEGGEEKTARAQDWIRNQQTNREMDTGWVFAGSVLAPDPFDPSGAKKYWANDGGDFIAVVNLPTAVLDMTVRSLKNPEERTFEAWTERIPPEGTPVVMTLTPVLGKKK